MFEGTENFANLQGKRIFILSEGRPRICFRCFIVYRIRIF